MDLREVEFFYVSGLFAEHDWLVEGDSARVLVATRDAVAFEFADLDDLVARLDRPLQSLALLSQLGVLQFEDLVDVLQVVGGGALPADDGAGRTDRAQAWRRRGGAKRAMVEC